MVFATPWVVTKAKHKKKQQLYNNFTFVNVFSRSIVGFNSDILELQSKEILE